MGHHGGLPDGGNRGDSDASLCARLVRPVNDYSNYQSEIDVPQTAIPPDIKPIGNAGFTLASLVKMLHSCLVDADFQDTEQFMSDVKINRGDYSSLGELNVVFSHYMNGFTKADKPINVKRSEILNSCLEKSTGKSGMFTLTVPTGAGKTLSSMAFALNHAVFHHMERVIFAIPYTSIIEQNARVFKDILGEEVVLEHHSNFDFDTDEHDPFNRKKLSSENWDIPIIVTTNVQFFESFFQTKILAVANCITWQTASSFWMKRK